MRYNLFMLDLIIKNVRVVRPNKNAIDLLDLGIKDGKFVQIAPEINASEAKEVVDGKNHLRPPPNNTFKLDLGTASSR